jgi:hypothetical protein
VITRERLKLALGLTGILFFTLLTLLLYGCAVRYTPGGGTTPATAFEQMLVWNTALAQANDAVATNVIALQQSGVLTIPQAKIILAKQGAIAQADQRLTQQIQAAATCGHQNAGASPTPAQIDAAAAACAKASVNAFASDLALISQFLTDLNDSLLLGIKDPVKRKELSDLLTAVSTLVGKIHDALYRQGVVKAVQEVQPWLTLQS